MQISLSEVPVLGEFSEIANPNHYVGLPDDWFVGVSDVVDSTTAIASGRYKSVNMAGAAVIASVSNAVGLASFPFVFGGDGASFAVPPAAEAAARRALAEAATLAREEYGLELRVGGLSVGEIRKAGHDVRVARYGPSPNLAYAMFSGGGLTYAESLLKGGRIRIPAAPAGSRPDVTGLSCRFDPMASRRGVILSLIVKPGREGDTSAYRQVISRILALLEAGSGSPVPPEGPPLRLNGSSVALEQAAARGGGLARLLEQVRIGLRYLFVVTVFRLRLPIAGFRPMSYLADLVANSDYRKYDDGLRVTVDCGTETADALDAMLAEEAKRGAILYGLHRQSSAIMTCFTPSALQRDHIHFIDGAEGGYAAAAAQLKRNAS